MLGRRSFLKALGIGAASAPMAAEQVKAAAMGVDGVALGSLDRGTAASVGGSASECVSVEGGARYRSFADFLADGGRKRIEEQARDMGNRIDPDIMGMVSWSLTTKCRKQWERNVKRAEDMQRSWFERMLRGSDDGSVRWYW